MIPGDDIIPREEAGDVPPAPRREIVRPLAFLLPAVLWLYREAALRGQAFFDRDLHVLWYNQVLAFKRSLAAGAWPVWDPDMAFGFPLWANPNNQVLYPPTWLNLAMPPWTYYTLFVVGHSLFSGLGAYLLGRRLDVSRTGSLLAAAVWISCGPFVSLVSLWNHLAGAAWLPWGMLAADRALASPGRARLAWLSIVLAMPILAGSPEVAVMVWCLAGLQALRVMAGIPAGARLGRLLPLAAAAALALALSAGQWLPTLAYLRGTARWNLAAAVRSYWSIHPLLMLQTLFPVPVGDLPLLPSVRAALTESREPFLRSLYLGLPALVLAAGGWLAPRRGHVRFFLAVGAVSAVVALGDFTPVFHFLAAAVPPLRTMRFPAKFMIPVALSASFLAGLGLDAWRSPSRDRRRVALAAVTAAAVLLPSVLLAAAARLRPDVLGHIFLAAPPGGTSWAELLRPAARAMGLSAAAGMAVLALSLAGGRRPVLLLPAALLAGAEMFLFSDSLNATAPTRLFTYRPPVLEAIFRQQGRRIFVYDYLTAPDLSRRHLGREHPYLVLMRGNDPPWIQALSFREYLLPPVADAWGIRGSFDADGYGLQTRPLVELRRRMRSLEGTPAYTRLLRLGGVTHVVALHRKGFEGLAGPKVFRGRFSDPILLFSVPDPLPEVYAVGRSRLAGKDVAAALTSPGFDPGREIVVEKGPVAEASPDFRGFVGVTDRRPDAVVLEADLSEAGYVVLLDAYGEGWRATVDGRPAEILRANAVFMAVPAGPGRHDIRLIYRPSGLAAGLLLSAAALAALPVLCLWRRRPGGPRPPPGGDPGAAAA